MAGGKTRKLSGTCLRAVCLEPGIGRGQWSSPPAPGATKEHGGRQRNRPIGVRAAAPRAMMPGDEIDGRGLDCAAAFAAQATEQIFKGHNALARDQHAHGIADRAASAMQTAIAMRPYVDRRRGLHKTHIRCMARLPNAGEAKFLQVPDSALAALAPGTFGGRSLFAVNPAACQPERRLYESPAAWRTGPKLSPSIAWRPRH